MPIDTCGRPANRGMAYAVRVVTLPSVGGLGVALLLRSLEGEGLA
eukprot:SAG31_NODE_3543_length_4142_cov_11.404622_1_plen_45_part_00